MADLTALPPELIAHVLSLLPSPEDLARADCTGRLFHGGPASPSLVAIALRMRAARRHGLASTSTYATGPTTELGVQAMLWDECRQRLPSARAHGAGFKHSAALSRDGVVLTWGGGAITPEDELEECLAMGDHALQVRTWMDARKQMAPRPVASLANVHVSALSSSPEHTLALTACGQVFSFGRGCGLGHGASAADLLVRRARRIDALTGVRIGEVSAGYNHSLAVSADGRSLFSFGHGWSGALGHGGFDDCLQPARVYAPALEGERVVCASAGFNFSLVVTQSGRALAFGDDGARSTDKHGCGRLGLGRLPHARPLPEGATEGETRVHTPTELRLWATAAGRTERVRAAGASAGRWFSIVLAANGHAYSFGHGENGKLGHGDEAARCVPTRVEALVGSGAGDAVVHASAGGDHAIFVRADGRVYGCGFNRRGQLGQGDDADDVLTPRQLRGLDGERALSASAGLGHSLVATASGALFSFGNGKSGKLGHGDEESQRLPKRIAALQLAGAHA